MKFIDAFSYNFIIMLNSRENTRVWSCDGKSVCVYVCLHIIGILRQLMFSNIVTMAV